MGEYKVLSRKNLLILGVVAILLALPLSLHPGSNVFCRLAMTFSIVDSGTVAIDDWKDSTNDYSVYNGHIYNDKAPGSSFLAVPSYALFKMLSRGNVNYEFARLFIRLTTLLLFILAGAIVCMKVLAQMGIDPKWFAPAWLFGTVAFPFSLLLFGHQYAACFLVFAFYFLFKHKNETEEGDSYKNVAFAGFFCGLAIFTEFPAAIPCFFLGLYLLSFERRIKRVLVFGALGALAPGGALMLYNKLIFGGPLTMAYSHLKDSANSAGMSDGFLGVGIPKISSFIEIIFSPQGGLLFTAPWLIFAVAGFILMMGSKNHLGEGLLFFFITIAHVLFNSSYWEPGGAMSFGPRHLVPVVPFIAMGAWYGGMTISKQLRPVFYLFVVFSIAVTAFGTYADPLMPDRLENPLFEFAIHILSTGFGLESPFGINGARLLGIFYAAMILVWFVTREKPVKKPDGKQLTPAMYGGAVLVLFYFLVFPYVAMTDHGIRHQVLGNYYLGREAYDLAEKQYAKAATHRVDPYIHYYRGRALSKLGRPIETKMEFQKTLKLAPNFQYKDMLNRAIDQLSKRDY